MIRTIRLNKNPATSRPLIGGDFLSGLHVIITVHNTSVINCNKSYAWVGTIVFLRTAFEHVLNQRFTRSNVKDS